MTKGNRQPTNNARLSLTSELLDYLASMPNKKGIPKGFQILLGFFETEKEGFIAKFGEQIYKEHIKRYSRNRTEMRKEKLKREEEKQKKLEANLRLKRQEIQLRKKELALREKNSDMRTEGKIENEIFQNEEELAQTKRKIEAMKKILAKYGKSPNKDAIQKLEFRRDFLIKRLKELSKRKSYPNNPKEGLESCGEQNI